MNPILATILTVYTINCLLFTVYGVIRIIVMMRMMPESEDLSPDEFEQMADRHWLVSALHPIAYWWIYPYRFMRFFIGRMK